MHLEALHSAPACIGDGLGPEDIRLHYNTNKAGRFSEVESACIGRILLVMHCGFYTLWGEGGHFYIGRTGLVFELGLVVARLNSLEVL